MTIVEIQEGRAANIGNLYDLISRNHPQWLRPTRTGVNGAAIEPNVWVDNQRIGTLAVLRTMPLGGISQVRYLSPSEAQGQLGLNNLGGAILISTR